MNINLILNDDWGSNGKWVGNLMKGEEKCKLGNLCEQQIDVFDTTLFNLIERCSGIEVNDIDIRLMSHVKFKKKWESETTSSYQQHRIERGDVIELLADGFCALSDKIIIPSSSGYGQRLFLLVVNIAGSSGDDAWALVVDLNLINSNLFRVPNVSRARMSVTKLTSSVRKVVGIHACAYDGGCVIDLGMIAHTKDVIGGGYFFLFHRNNGYPPRRS